MKAHRLLYHLAVGSRVVKEKKKENLVGRVEVLVVLGWSIFRLLMNSTPPPKNPCNFWPPFRKFAWEISGEGQMCEEREPGAP